MGTVSPPPPVKLIVGMLTADPALFAAAEERLVALYGPVDLHLPSLAFDQTDYYEAELGGNLQRQFLAFEGLIDPGRLPEIKLATNALEAEFGQRTARALRRKINLDPGYVDLAKLVLATTKDYAHRLYLGRGIYAEVTLRFQRGTFAPWEWTYRDYRTEPYLRFFNEVRQRYREQQVNQPHA